MCWAFLLLAFCTQNALSAVTGTSGPSCSVPVSDLGAGLPACPPNATATLADAQALAWKFAPVVHFHPLERYHLQVRYNYCTLCSLPLLGVAPVGFLLSMLPSAHAVH